MLNGDCTVEGERAPALHEGPLSIEALVGVLSVPLFTDPSHQEPAIELNHTPIIAILNAIGSIRSQDVRVESQASVKCIAPRPAI